MAGRGVARRGMAGAPMVQRHKQKRKRRKSMTEMAVKTTQRMPILLHGDNIDWADKMLAWQGDGENKKNSTAGDDRTPAWRWIGSLYCDKPDGIVTIPSENIMASIMGGAAMVPTGKRQQTFKALSQTGLLCPDFHWPLLVNGKTISMASIAKLLDEPDFKRHVEAVADLGFCLFTKPVKVQTKRHIRVRPRFDNWSIEGTIIVTDNAISVENVRRFLEMAGKYKGLGDWRPGSKTPGPWGTFVADVR